MVGPPTAAVDKLGTSRLPLSVNVLPDDVIDSAMEYASREGLLVKVCINSTSVVVFNTTY